jgi:hypothetical protein
MMRVGKNHNLEEMLIRLGLELVHRMKLLNNHCYGDQNLFLERLIFIRQLLMFGLPIIKLLK